MEFSPLPAFSRGTSHFFFVIESEKAKYYFQIPKNIPTIIYIIRRIQRYFICDCQFDDFQEIRATKTETKQKLSTIVS